MLQICITCTMFCIVRSYGNHVANMLVAPIQGCMVATTLDAYIEPMYILLC